ncbi:MAG: D-cysteine desulfhydrase family protein [Planctomycetota bacterium]
MIAGEPQRVALANLPTPLIRLERLGQELDGAQIWMKRDDLTGLELSGNKVRKLEYVLAAALADEVDTIVTEGTAQSNHCRATAAACAKLGLHVMLLYRPHPSGEPQGNQLLDTLFGAEYRSYQVDEFRARHDEIVQEVLAELKTAGRRPRYTPAGSSEPLGCWGYIRAMAELAEQMAVANIDECDLVLPLSSGGTYTGALLGQALHKLDELRLLAVPVSDDVAYHQQAIRTLYTATSAQYEALGECKFGELHLLDGYVGAGYAIPYESELEAIRLLARVEGIMLDPVYTGKAFCALLDEIRAGRLGQRRPVIFLHTGGIFSNFAWPQTLLS